MTLCFLNVSKRPGQEKSQWLCQMEGQFVPNSRTFANGEYYTSWYYRITKCAFFPRTRCSTIGSRQWPQTRSEYSINSITSDSMTSLNQVRSDNITGPSIRSGRSVHGSHELTKRHRFWTIDVLLSAVATSRCPELSSIDSSVSDCWSLWTVFWIREVDSAHWQDSCIWFRDINAPHDGFDCFEEERTSVERHLGLNPVFVGDVIVSECRGNRLFISDWEKYNPEIKIGENTMSMLTLFVGHYVMLDAPILCANVEQSKGNTSLGRPI
jgi:hypothetical protein